MAKKRASRYFTPQSTPVNLEAENGTWTNMLDDAVKRNVEIKSLSNDQLKAEDDSPLSFGEWLKLNLDEERLQLITNNILEEIEGIDKERKLIEEKIKQYRNQYNQVVAKTSLPFPGSFNLCVPITSKNVDACVSQTEEAFEEVDPKWTVATPPDKSLIPARDIQEKILDYYSDTEMEDVDVWTKIYHDAFVLGNAWLCMVFKREFVRTRDFVEYDNLDNFIQDYPDDYGKYPKYVKELSAGKTVKLIIEYNQEVCRSSKPEYAEWEDVYVPLATEGLQGMLKARIVARRIWMKYSDILELENEGDYREGITKKIIKKVEVDKSIGEDIDPEYMKKEYETFEVQYFVDVDGDGKLERCMFNIEKEHRLCMRDIRYPYNHNRPYVIPYYIQKTNKGMYQPGLGEKLQQLNIAANALINHTLNASIIANSLSLKVRSGTDAVRALYEHQWYPGSILELMNVDDVQQFTFTTPNLSSLINLFGMIERFSQDVSGIVNYMLGQSDTEDPEAPASKTIALMRKSELKLRRYIKCLKRSNNEAGYQALRLIYQYVPKERIAKILNVDVKEVTLLKYPLRLTAQSSGFAVEKMFERRDNMQWLSLLMKEPLVAQSNKRRVKLYEIIAKDYGSNWDKKLAQVISSDDVVVEEKEKLIQEGKVKVIQKAISAAKEQGASDEEVQAIAEQAAANFEQMSGSQFAGGENEPA